MTAYESPSTGLPRLPEPYWRDSAEIPSFNILNNDLKADVVIIGGGMVGITTAFLLVQGGLKVALLEAGEILNGATGHTTAKITAQHDLIYDELIGHFGREKARLYYDANRTGLRFIRETVQEHQIECDLSRQDAYVYTSTDQYLSRLQDEYTAYQNLGIEGEFTDRMPLPLPIKGALVMKNQAQFHPLKYLARIAEYVVRAGGSIYEYTTAVDIEDGSRPSVLTRDGSRITCDQVIVCTHFPFYDGRGLYFSRMYAERSYVLGIRPKQEFPGGMYINAESPSRSLRSTPLDRGGHMVLVVGEGHKTGQGIPTLRHYEALRDFADNTLGAQEILYRWSTQDLTTIDKVPYIGRISSGTSNILVATGFRKWGMSNGTAAALLLRDIVMEKDNPYLELYSPQRFHADPDIKNFVVQNADVAKHLVEGKFEMILPLPEEVRNGEGLVVSNHGRRAGAYRDEEGRLHMVDTTCTHMGCELNWNSGERTWDCPCHASRFSIDGDVIEGPALNPLHLSHDSRNRVEPAILHHAADARIEQDQLQ